MTETPNPHIVDADTLTGDEPTDIQHYASAHASFPHEPTSDQFFDEAQWESYRRLGWHLGGKIFDQPATVRAKLPEGPSDCRSLRAGSRPHWPPRQHFIHRARRGRRRLPAGRCGADRRRSL